MPSADAAALPRNHLAQVGWNAAASARIAREKGWL
jgi:hypothetical protein